MQMLNLRNLILRIDENLSERRLIMQRLKERRVPTGIWPTHLISLRKAYCEFKHPEIMDTLDAQARKSRGTKFHELFERAVAKEPYCELKVTYEDISGKIDIFRDYPIELKTTKKLPSSGLPVWPGYAEQVGIYCMMTESKEGQILVHITPREGDWFDPNGELRAFKVQCPELEPIRTEVLRRRNLLRDALDRNDPSKLPACSWCGVMECIYSAVCDAKNAPKPENEICALLKVTETPEEAEFFKKKLLQSFNLAAVLLKPDANYTPWELLTPRQTYFVRTYGKRVESGDEALGHISRRAKQEGLKDAILDTSRGEFAYKPLEYGDIWWRWALYHHGLPTVINRCWMAEVVPRENVPDVFADELHVIGLQSAVENIPNGRLIVEYPNVVEERLRIIVYDIHFRNTKPFMEFADARIKSLNDALEKKKFDRLEMCKEWRCEWKGKRCKYWEECRGNKI